VSDGVVNADALEQVLCESEAGVVGDYQDGSKAFLD
jgi:hypothetical protein